ncbi:helix-turn-helix transcriptional regulator, partial [Pseudomonas aeruginosa]|nr:helix-turn-helix transcriptional regulator [Pseudomonas aeruginosa]
ALASLAAMQALASRNQSWRFFAQAMAEEINLILQDSGPDRLKRAEQRLKSVDWNKMAAHYRNMAFNPVNWSLGVSRVRLLQGRGHFSEALQAVPAGLQGAAQLSDLVQRLRLDILAALSYQRLGYQERANSLLGECLINAEREGVRSLFIEEGDGIRQLLQ